MNFALEVTGIFLFIAGMIYLSFSGKLGDMFRDRAPGQILLVTLITGFALYHWGGMLWDLANLPEDAPAPRASVPELPPPPPPEPRRATRHSSRPAPQAEEPTPEPPVEAPQTVIVEVPPAEPFVPPVAPPAVVPPSSGPDPFESKAKRGIKAVGRFLHLAKKTNN